MTRKGEKQMVVTKETRQFEKITGGSAGFNSWARYYLQKGLQEMKKEQK